MASDRVVVPPMQTLTDPAGPIAEGVGFTSTGAVTKQPPVEYEILTPPVATPVTNPPDDTVATEVLPLLHVPPPVASDMPIVDPGQIEAEEGDIAAGVAETVTVVVTRHPDAPV